MPERRAIPLRPVRVDVGGDEFAEVCSWPFPDSYITSLLKGDIPQRRCAIFAYTDPSHEIVGFGSLQLCREYAPIIGHLPEGHRHPYIPLLAVKPDKQGRGHGTEIVKHLTAEAVICACVPTCHPTLFLDVYEDNAAAIRLYTNADFVILGSDIDERENNRPYLIMARSVANA